jgi:Zn-dependent protease with chaperone function
VTDFGYNNSRTSSDSHKYRTQFHNFDLLPRFVDKPYGLVADRVVMTLNRQREEDYTSEVYLLKIMSRLRKNAPGDNIPSQVYLWDSSRVFWFGVPGGKLYVSSGLINSVNNESELAGVLAHELGHLYLRHYKSAHPLAS